jgi:hypothetical protein
MRHVAPRLIKAIEAAQAEAQEGLANAGRGRPVHWWWLILSLPADKLAVVTLKAVFNEKPREFTFHMPVSNVAAKISRMCWDQLDYETWKEQQADVPPAENEFLLFLRTNKTVDAKSFKRFSDRIQRQRIEKWDHKAGLIFGCKLVDLLAASVPEWFEVKTNRLRGGRMELQLMLSEEAKNTLADIAEQCELSRPMLLPMTCPPAEWRYCPK